MVLSVIRKLWPSAQVLLAKPEAFAYGVTNAYAQPEKLGIDRWLGMIACYNLYSSGFCLAGCGTAITVDVVDSTGQHQGGLISPGLLLMKESPCPPHGPAAVSHGNLPAWIGRSYRSSYL